MDGHLWANIAESEVSVTEGRKVKKKTQILWECGRCGAKTIVDKDRDPERMKELYGLVPEEVDGAIIMEPLIMECDEAIVYKVMTS